MGKDRSVFGLESLSGVAFCLYLTWDCCTDAHVTQHVSADLQFVFVRCDLFVCPADLVRLSMPMTYDLPTLLVVVGLRVGGFLVWLVWSPH